jgi:hypothetical protein
MHAHAAAAIAAAQVADLCLRPTHLFAAALMTSMQGMEAYCVRAFAEALEVVPYTLAENAGLNPIQIVTELRNLHADGAGAYYGINVKKVCLYYATPCLPLMLHTIVFSCKHCKPGRSCFVIVIVDLRQREEGMLMLHHAYLLFCID